MTNIIKPVLEQGIKVVGEQLKRNGKDVVICGLCSIGVYGFHEYDKSKATNRAYKNGFEDASNIYAVKFRKQTEEFLNKEKVVKNELQEYRDLIAEYDKEIERLQNKINKSKQDKTDIDVLLEKREKLENLRIEVSNGDDGVAEKL